MLLIKPLLIWKKLYIISFNLKLKIYNITDDNLWLNING